MPDQANKGGTKIRRARTVRVLLLTMAAGLALVMAASPALLRGADRWRGSKVTVTTLSGSIFKGELIGVREDAVIILESPGEKTLMVAEIESVRIVKKSPTIACAIIGGLAGGITAGLIARRPSENDDLGTGLKRLLGYPLWLGVGTGVGMGVGMFVAQAIGKDKVIVFKGRPAAEVEAGLKTLRKEARVQNYK
jgi:hypothetical protein